MVWSIIITTSSEQDDESVITEVEANGNVNIEPIIQTPITSTKINEIPLIDKGSYMLVPTKLDPRNDPDVIRILCISDLHNNQRQLKPRDLPFVDIIISAGDMTMLGTLEELKAYDTWINEYLRKHRRALHSIIITVKS